MLPSQAWRHTLKLAQWMQEQMDLCEIEAGLVYIAKSRAVKAMQYNPSQKEFTHS